MPPNRQSGHGKPISGGNAVSHSNKTRSSEACNISQAICVSGGSSFKANGSRIEDTSNLSTAGNIGGSEKNDDEDSHGKRERLWMHYAEMKRLFICCDGTWQNASGTIAPLTNVAKLARAVYRLGDDEYQSGSTDDGRIIAEAIQNDVWDNLSLKGGRVGLVRQIVYYSSGIGGQSALNIERSYSGLTGKGLESNILNAYCFICNNYNFRSNKDEIVLVGFSRGAFTVRCLANFIDKVGLLRRKGLIFLRPLFDSWKKCGRARGKEREKLEEELKQKVESLGDLVRTDVPIPILAEWDTVSAIGLPLGLWKERLSFVNDAVPKCVKHAFFALAIDERRQSFKPRQWTAKVHAQTNVDQCAFVGCHSDVGGGNPDVGLSTLSLIWMVSKIRAHSKAEFDEGTLLQFMFPVQPERFPLCLTSRLVLKNFAGTNGPIHQSFRGWWRIPWLLSLGFWHGKRDNMFDMGKGEFELKIHFTVGLLNKNPSKCRLSKGYTHEEKDAYWAKNTNNQIKLKEDGIEELESALLREWIELAELFQNQQKAQPPKDLKDKYNINWTRVASTLDLGLPNGKMEENALITIIKGWVEGITRDCTREL